jgi:arsenate reductase (thioredoxin)
MSEGLFRLAAHGRHHGLSAGTRPDQHVHPVVIAVMNEIGIDLSNRVPRELTPELAQRADLIVTMGCGDECPFTPGKRYLDWELTDPAGRPIDEVRAIRDEIIRRALALTDALSETADFDGR